MFRQEQVTQALGCMQDVKVWLEMLMVGVAGQRIRWGKGGVQGSASRLQGSQAWWWAGIKATASKEKGGSQGSLEHR